MDNLLSNDALLRLRAFCREATIWNDVKKTISAPIYWMVSVNHFFLQIAHELRQALPAILADYPPIEMWAYKCDHNLSGLNKHANYAAVNINFWISLDDANIDPESGGLVVYKDEAPLSWDFRRYNTDQESIDNYHDEKGGGSITVPHRSNRALIFNSNLFHKTDESQFRRGYSNRRTNVTILFGNRFNR